MSYIEISTTCRPSTTDDPLDTGPGDMTVSLYRTQSRLERPLKPCLTVTLPHGGFRRDAVVIFTPTSMASVLIRLDPSVTRLPSGVPACRGL